MSERRGAHLISDGVEWGFRHPSDSDCTELDALLVPSADRQF